MHRHPLPTPDEIFARLNQGAWFTQIDFADAYLQMEVEDDSKELVTINTHKGLFQYHRLPFRVKCAPGIFQEAMDRMITGLEGCAAYLDDVIVLGPTPDCAWERIHIDFAGPMEGMMFLIVVDAFSKWPEVVQMRTSTTTATIKELGRIFAQQGYPKVLVSDNGTQFTTKEFQDYCQKNGIQHIRSAPYQPHCNGQAERFVDTFIRTLQKLQGRE